MSTNLKPHQYEFCLSKMHDDNINVLVALKHTPRNCNNPGSSQPYHTPQACARKLYDRSSGVDHSKSDVSLKIHPSRGHRSAPTTQFVSFCVIVPSPPSLPECVHSTNHPFTPPSALRVPPPTKTPASNPTGGRTALPRWSHKGCAPTQTSPAAQCTRCTTGRSA